MLKIIVVTTALVVSGTLGMAQERAAAPAQPAGESRGADGRGRSLNPEEMAKSITDRQAQVAKELARIDEESAKLNPESAALLARTRIFLSTLNDNLKAQAEAAKAGDQEKLKTLLDQGATLEANGQRAMIGMHFFRKALEPRALAQKLPAATGDAVGAARQKYVEALTALADFNTQLANNPPESTRGGLSADTLSQETTLTMACERTKIEYDYQVILAARKDAGDKMAGDPAVKPASDALTAKATAVRDTQLKVVDAQEALYKAQAARAQAESEMESAKQEQSAAFRSKADQGRGATEQPSAVRSAGEPSATRAPAAAPASGPPPAPRQ